MTEQTKPIITLFPGRFINNLQQESTAVPILGAVCYVAHNTGDGLAYTFPPGALESAAFLTADMLIDGDRLSVFSLCLQEGENGHAFRMNFGLLNQCSARLRIPLEAVNQNRWRFPREGAWLKPMCGGESFCEMVLNQRDSHSPHYPQQQRLHRC